MQHPKRFTKNLHVFKFDQTLSNMLQHIATGCPNVCNTSCPTMLRWNVDSLWPGLYITRNDSKRILLRRTESHLVTRVSPNLLLRLAPKKFPKTCPLNEITVNRLTPQHCRAKSHCFWSLRVNIKLSFTDNGKLLPK